jgi:hypothetical protein
LFFFSGALIFIGFAVASLFIDPNEENHLVPDVEVQYICANLTLDLVHIVWDWLDMLDLVQIGWDWFRYARFGSN